jgi:hypothetical protein
MAFRHEELRPLQSPQLIGMTPFLRQVPVKRRGCNMRGKGASRGRVHELSPPIAGRGKPAPPDR